MCEGRDKAALDAAENAMFTTSLTLDFRTYLGMDCLDAHVYSVLDKVTDSTFDGAWGMARNGLTTLDVIGSTGQRITALLLERRSLGGLDLGQAERVKRICVQRLADLRKQRKQYNSIFPEGQTGADDELDAMGTDEKNE